MSKYSAFQHHHNFAVWAAARATQRAFTNVENLRQALERCGLVEIVENPDKWPESAAAFDVLHRQWCVAIAEHLEQLGVRKATFGRAAKLTAIYIKAMIVLPQPESHFARVAHPPIDAILLRRLAADENWPTRFRKIWRSTTWTKLDKNAYYDLIRTFRDCSLDEPFFWHLERYWPVTND